jgi:glycerol kinase
MYIGIDLGTSGVKAILLNEQGEVVASHTEKLNVSRPHPLWSEQDPEHWWLATDRAMKALGAQHSLREVKALGIAGRCTARRCWISNSASCARRFYGMMAAAVKSARCWKRTSAVRGR